MTPKSVSSDSIASSLSFLMPSFRSTRDALRFCFAEGPTILQDFLLGFRRRSGARGLRDKFYFYTFFGSSNFIFVLFFVSFVSFLSFLFRWDNLSFEILQRKQNERLPKTTRTKLKSRVQFSHFMPFDTIRNLSFATWTIKNLNKTVTQKVFKRTRVTHKFSSIRILNYRLRLKPNVTKIEADGKKSILDRKLENVRRLPLIIDHSVKKEESCLRGG